MALEIILRLDIAQEGRALSTSEINLRRQLKSRVMGLAVIERARKRQASRITNLRAGDAKTKYFHLKVNGQRRKNFIQRLKDGQLWKTRHEDKEVIIRNHFQAIMASPSQRSIDF
uniref:Uncharacterized protein n=1 Tax=Oryza punctata TaxID=4537 RepID=A0A0E0M570_ORYPU